jgi:hypothetical protein
LEDEESPRISRITRIERDAPQETCPHSIIGASSLRALVLRGMSRAFLPLLARRKISRKNRRTLLTLFWGIFSSQRQTVSVQKQSFSIQKQSISVQKRNISI